MGEDGNHLGEEAGAKADQLGWRIKEGGEGREGRAETSSSQETMEMEEAEDELNPIFSDTGELDYSREPNL